MHSLTKNPARLAWTGTSLLALAVLAFAPASAKASFVIADATGQDGDMEALNATAAFTTGAGTVSITLTNLVNGNDVRSAGQAISGIEFTLSTTASGVSGAGDSGQLIDVGSGGIVATVGGNPNRWEGHGHITSSGQTIELLVLGGGKPSEMILGLPDTVDGDYDNANASITRNFSPFVEGSATFNLNVAGVTADTTVTAATFFFGTGPDMHRPGTTLPDSILPAPSSALLLGVGGLGLAGFMALPRRRRVTGKA